MPYKVKGKCVYKKDTGKKVGCTKGPVKKYLAALHINAKESVGTFKEHFFRTAGGDQRVTDTSATAEATYADGQDSTMPAVQPLMDQTGKESVIQDVIRDLQDLKVTHDWNTPVNDDLIQAMADTLEGVGIEPTDMYAAIGANSRKQKQYLITGPSSWKGGNGALNDLKAILAGGEPREIEEDESVPSSDLPYGSADSNPGMADLSEMYRRDFLKKIGRAAAVTGVAPGAMGKIAMNVATGGASFNLTKAISDHLMNNVPMFVGSPFEGFAVNSMSEIVSTAEDISSRYNSVVKALQDSGVSFPPHLATLARAIFDKVNEVKDMSEYSKLHPDEIPEALAIEEGENMLDDIFDPDGVIYDFNKELMDFGFKTNRITPEAQKFLEDNYEIYKCDFVKDSASKARRDKKEAEDKKAADEYEKEEYKRQQQHTAKDINYSRMDTKGGAEDIDYKNTVDENFIDSKRRGIKKSKLDQVIEEMNRRDFIKKMGQGAQAAVGSTMMPKGAVGSVLKGALAGAKNFNLDQIYLNLFDWRSDLHVSPIDTYKSSANLLKRVNWDLNNYTALLDAANNNVIKFTPHDINGIRNCISTYSLVSRILQGKGTQKDMEAVRDDYEGKVNLRALNDFIVSHEEGWGEEAYDLLTPAFRDNLLSPETIKKLEDNGIYWYDYVDTPEAKKIRKQQEIENQKIHDEWQKKIQKDAEDKAEKDKQQEITHGSRFDWGGGEEDRDAARDKYIYNQIHNPYGGPGTYTVDENFIDKKGPGRPGDSKRHGIKKKPSLASLDKIVHSKTASPRKKQLAHWQANMRRGKAKKK